MYVGWLFKITTKIEIGNLAAIASSTVEIYVIKESLNYTKRKVRNIKICHLRDIICTHYFDPLNIESRRFVG